MRRPKVLFITAPYHAGVVESAGRWPNLAFINMAGELRAAGFQPVIYDAMTRGDSIAEIAGRMAAERPEVVCTSAYTPAIGAAMEVLRAAKDTVPECVTVVGGVHATLCYGEVLERYGDVVDYVVRGEGELTLPMLLECLRDGGSPGKVRGVAYLEDGRLAATAPRPFIQDLDITRPAWDLVDWSDYTFFPFEGSRLAIMETSRGCPFDCAFCSQQKFWSRRWRARRPEAVVAHLEELADRYGVDVVMFSDEYPTADRDRWERLLDLLIERDLGVRILMETRVHDIVRDAAIMEKYRRAGVIHLYVGVEATNQGTLDLFKKDLKCEESYQALRIIDEAGIVSECSFVFGLPGDTRESVRAALDLARYYDPDMPHFLLIAPWPYSDLYPSLKDYIVTQDYARYNFVEPVTRTDALGPEDLKELVVECYAGYYGEKLPRLVASHPSFKRDYMLRSFRAMLKNSFLAQHVSSMREVISVTMNAPEPERVQAGR